ncbi:tetratricopeptide repeat protein [Sporosarcina thermotolerans]|uniref:Tetratricopeptide repeat protein n=1 Tax=Sporosarcina thermotolerans TaxID=633404 RepID=A0AAW9A727_9BACL|nr:tetratricopeptide repeat protein [Sporosarcina thermotolerans]MDW0117167.1 tetratricopeptide repeat protein [Sporosarcina thermotolerans]WHT47339.1 tetratricopeptide repeat protein [Sporosarcina thermotolerans]
MGRADSIDSKLEFAFKLFESKRLSKAEEIYHECLSSLEESSNNYKVALHWLGYVKSELKKYDEARSIYIKLREIAKFSSDLQDELIAIHQLGMVERMARNYEEAIKLFDVELNLLKNSYPDFYVGFAANYYEQGYILLKKGSLIEAEKLMNQSLQYSKQSNDPIALGCSLRGLGEIFNAKGEIERAKGYFEESIFTFKESDDIVAVEEVKSILDKI